MKEEKFLPLGSVILVKGSVKKLVLIGRGVVAILKGEQKYFDYVACTYPEGLIGENVLYLNHEDIEEVIQKGFQDEDDFRMQKSLKEHLDGLLKIETFAFWIGRRCDAWQTKIKLLFHPQNMKLLKQTIGFQSAKMKFRD